MDVRRRTTRQKSLLRGRVYFNNRSATADCIVRDISAEGARLLFSDELTIPDVVDLYIPQRDRTYRAQIVWRHGSEAGIAFIPGEEEMQASAPETLAARVAKLEQEIEVLKRTLKRLKSAQSIDTDAA